VDSPLIATWLGADVADVVEIVDEASVAVARELARDRARDAHLADAARAALATITSELAHNQLAHAARGRIIARAAVRMGIPGVEIVAADEGPGISDPTVALEGRGPTQAPDGSLGAGVSGARRLADEMDIDVRLGQGTCVWARKFAESGGRRREIGILGRPCEGEVESGDHAMFVRTEHDLLLAVADGLGHGPPAFTASQAAIGAVAGASDRDLLALFDLAHVALAATRGAVLSLARVDDERRSFETAAVGNVATHLERPRESRRYAGVGAVLGAPGRVPKPKNVERTTIDPREALIMFTDGLLTRSTASEDPALFVEHPIVIAHAMMNRFARINDDALILVAR
jgi:anti-sigma regulatory factor (Ser/Thr protein kinase)